MDKFGATDVDAGIEMVFAGQRFAIASHQKKVALGAMARWRRPFRFGCTRIGAVNLLRYGAGRIFFLRLKWIDLSKLNRFHRSRWRHEQEYRTNKISHRIRTIAFD